MNRIALSFLLVLTSFIGAVSVCAEEAALPVEAQAAVEAVAAPAEEVVAVAEEAPAVADVAASLDNLDFASGEIAAFDAASGKLDVKVYLDGTGDAKEQTIALIVDASTEITNGEADLKSDALKANAEIDVEYDTTSNKATYIFIY